MKDEGFENFRVKDIRKKMAKNFVYDDKDNVIYTLEYDRSEKGIAQVTI